MPFPSFDEERRLCERAVLRRWKAGQEMSGHQNPVIAVLTLRGIREGEGGEEEEEEEEGGRSTKTSLNVNPT